MSSPRPISRSLKPLVFALCLVPLAWVVYKAVFVGLGANPNEALNRYLGDWALRFVLIALAVTPLRGLLKWNGLARYRRMFGLFAFAYVCFHLTSYIAIDQFFDWNEIWADISKRYYITIGMATFVMLVPLAVTSTNSMARRLGAKRWKNLHRLAYAAGAGGVIHYFMMVKADLSQPMIHAGVLAFLLGYRVVAWARRRSPGNPDRAESTGRPIQVV
ncbi:MAG: protein-methionine-sulfoxide reductase heme-binding subunit MsrQ [Rhodospirillales bacterium]